MKRLFILLLPLLFSAVAMADNQQSYQEFGDYKVYFSVFNSTFLTPEVASTYNLTRGKDQALINIALIKSSEDGDTEGLEAIISGHSQNLMQQRKELEFMEIKEQNTAYYLAPLRFINEEVLHFVINVKTTDNSQPFEVKFSKKLYVDR